MKLTKILTIIMILITICCCGKKELPNLSTEMFNYTSEIMAKANELAEVSPIFDLDKETVLVTAKDFAVTNKYTFPFIYGEVMNYTAELIQMFGADQLEEHFKELARTRAMNEALYREAVAAGFDVSDDEVTARVNEAFDGDLAAIASELDKLPFKMDFIREDFKRTIIIQQYRDALIEKYNVPPAESAVQKYYNENPELSTKKKRAIARHIFRNTEDMDDTQKANALSEMKALRSAMDTTADFMKMLVKSDDKDTVANGGLIAEYIEQGDTAEDIDNAIFSQPVTGGISDVVESKFGYHIFMVDSITPAERVPLENVKSQIEQIMIIDKQNEAIEAESKRVAKKYQIKMQ